MWKLTEESSKFPTNKNPSFLWAIASSYRNIRQYCGSQPYANSFSDLEEWLTVIEDKWSHVSSRFVACIV